MPTTRPRHLLTETDDLAAAIDAAVPMYPGESRADVLRHLVELGAETIAERHGRRQCLVRERAGGYPGLFPAGLLDELRLDLNDVRHDETSASPGTSGNGGFGDVGGSGHRPPRLPA